MIRIIKAIVISLIIISVLFFQSTFYTGRGDDVQVIDLEIGGTGESYKTQIVLPADYDPNRVEPYEWVIENHGRSDSVNSVFDINNAFYKNKRDHFINKGWIFVLPYTNSSWGNAYAVQRVIDSLNYVLANYNVKPKPLLIGQSMGGLVSLNTFVRNTSKFRGLALLFPVSDLDANYQPKAGNSDYQTSINTAYGCTLADYETVTAGYNPHDRLSDFANAGVKIKLWHGDADTIVNQSQSIQFRDGVNALNSGLVEVRSISGTGHDTNSLTPYLNELDSFIESLPIEIIEQPSFTLRPKLNFGSAFGEQEIIYQAKSDIVYSDSQCTQPLTGFTPTNNQQTVYLKNINPVPSKWKGFGVYYLDGQTKVYAQVNGQQNIDINFTANEVKSVTVTFASTADRTYYYEGQVIV